MKRKIYFSAIDQGQKMKSGFLKQSMVITLSVISLVVYSVAAQATALIRITPLGVAVDEQTVTDPVPISPDGFRTSFWSNGSGQGSIVDPLILILATPTDPAAAAPGPAPLLTYKTSNPANITSNAGITLGGTNVYGGSWNTTTGAAGTYDATTSNYGGPGGQISVYQYIGFNPAGSASEKYSNWNTASGLTSWDLWIYQIVFNPDFSTGDWVEFATNGLAEGTFVVGYGCTAVSGSSCSGQNSTQSTPFTFAGMVTVPEPGSIMLLGAGMIGFALFRRKRS